MVLKIEVLGVIPFASPPSICTMSSRPIMNKNDGSSHPALTTTTRTTTPDDEEPSTLMEYQNLCFASDFSLKNRTNSNDGRSTRTLLLPSSSPVSTITNMFDKNLGDQHPAALISDDDDGRNEEEDRLGETSKRTAAKTTTQSSVAPWFHGYHLSQEERERICRNANIRVAKLLTAREVRDNQRWTANPNNDGGVVRLVSGTVPILKDGRVLLISSRKDNGWSLPKGGWELDESLEEGAIRETFEEAGVLGLLGPFIIGSFLVESGKKKRKTMASAVSSSSSSSSSSLSNYSNHGKVTFCDMNELVPFATSTDSSTSPVPSHTHTCMTFFPMYIQQIADVWPENTRRRKAFSIDEAIQLVRPELRFLLEHIQQEGLHIVNR